MKYYSDTTNLPDIKPQKPMCTMVDFCVCWGTSNKLSYHFRWSKQIVELFCLPYCSVPENKAKPSKIHTQRFIWFKKVVEARLNSLFCTLPMWLHRTFIFNFLFNVHHHTTTSISKCIFLYLLKKFSMAKRFAYNFQWKSFVYSTEFIYNNNNNKNKRNR